MHCSVNKSVKNIQPFCFVRHNSFFPQSQRERIKCCISTAQRQKAENSLSCKSKCYRYLLFYHPSMYIESCNLLLQVGQNRIQVAEIFPSIHWPRFRLRKERKISSLQLVSAITGWWNIIVDMLEEGVFCTAGGLGLWQAAKLQLVLLCAAEECALQRHMQSSWLRTMVLC